MLIQLVLEMGDEEAKAFLPTLMGKVTLPRKHPKAAK
jgi:hypothetical protein